MRVGNSSWQLSGIVRRPPCISQSVRRTAAVVLISSTLSNAPWSSMMKGSLVFLQEPRRVAAARRPQVGPVWYLSMTSSALTKMGELSRTAGLTRSRSLTSSHGLGAATRAIEEGYALPATLDTEARVPLAIKPGMKNRERCMASCV